MSSRLHRLSALGQSVWINYLSRDLIESGALARAVAVDAVVGVTSNPSIFQQALAHGDAYDEQIAASQGEAKKVFLELAMRDVTTACTFSDPFGTERKAATATSRSRSTRILPPIPRPRSSRRPTSTRQSRART
jgi:transaldolase